VVTKALAVLALAGVAATGVVCAGSTSAQMSVSVTVVRSCTIERSPLLLTCTAGAASNVRISETFQPPAAAVMSEGSRVLTLNF
jgi:hypothetical protein